MNGPLTTTAGSSIGIAHFNIATEVKNEVEKWSTGFGIVSLFDNW